MTKQSIDTIDEQDSRRQPVWHVLVLNVFTFCAYSMVWFYKNWRTLSEEANKRKDDENNPLKRFVGISPWLRSLGLLLPVTFGSLLNSLSVQSPAPVRAIALAIELALRAMQIYLMFTLFRDIAAIHPKQAGYQHRHPILTGIVVTLTLMSLLSFRLLPGAGYMLFLTATIPLAFVQSWLNDFWLADEQPTLLVRHAFSGGELAALILGAVLLGLLVTHFMML